MRDFCKVSPTVWRSKKFRSLGSLEARHVYLYLLTCPHANSAGCFDLHPLYACADMCLSDIQFGDCIDTLCKAGLIEWDADENTVLIVNWSEFNGPANPKHALGIIAQLQQASSETLRLKAFQELSAEIIAKNFNREASVRKAMESFCIPYRNGIATETETETETRPRQDETRPETREEVSRQPRPAAALSGGVPSAERLMMTNMMRRTA